MIDYAIKRHDWYEDQRNKTLSLSIALLGLSSFLVAGLLNAEVKQMHWFRLFAGFSILSIVVTALLVIREYVAGAQKLYTHRSLADIRSWYFAYVVKDSIVTAATQDLTSNSKNEEIISTAWETFLRGWIEYQGPMHRGIEDLQQVFVLYLFQGIRQRSLRRMLEYATRGGTVIAVLLIPTILCAALRI